MCTYIDDLYCMMLQFQPLIRAALLLLLLHAVAGPHCKPMCSGSMRSVWQMHKQARARCCHACGRRPCRATHTSQQQSSVQATGSTQQSRRSPEELPAVTTSDTAAAQQQLVVRLPVLSVQALVVLR
jgi:hypothetical protein